MVQSIDSQPDESMLGSAVRYQIEVFYEVQSVSTGAPTWLYQFASVTHPADLIIICKQTCGPLAEKMLNKKGNLLGGKGLPPPNPFKGELSPNQRLEKAELLLEDQIYGPESIAVNRKTKKVYTGLKTGLICELDLDGKKKILRAVRLTSLEGCDGSYHTMPKCGRPLGMR
ncbi:hypothetical protein TELCIR_11856 [Teladorsagia circumcincta]|uniref:Uncharacterized protein n=1 Tax=Teladorsagia circumcincta TaxID=45464 RepID=A0A2G9U897_TELCI|nr:hypothetical protein TELCIR_11856 [Teladorsagia circumcincta]